jgi:hypothetical protein
VNLTLIGYLKGTDGHEVAIIANSKTHTTSRLRQGDTLCGMTVAKISMESVEILDKNKKSITIHTAKSQPFEDGRHVE